MIEIRWINEALDTAAIELCSECVTVPPEISKACHL